MPRTNCRLSPEFYSRPTQQVAQSLLGKTLVRLLPEGERLSGAIVEVEAYLDQGDLASHSARGLNKKNAAMFKSPGKLYVYPIHAKHCLNVVTEEAGRGAAVLVRALEPLEGQQRMFELRGLSARNSSQRLDIQQPGEKTTQEFNLKTAISLTSGPARLCQALAIDRRHDGLDLLTSDQVWIEENDQFDLDKLNIRCGTRIGISLSTELVLRWFYDGHSFVSGLVREHTCGKYWSWRHG